jgi:hypothetical protein
VVLPRLDEPYDFSCWLYRRQFNQEVIWKKKGEKTMEKMSFNVRREICDASVMLQEFYIINYSRKEVRLIGVGEDGTIYGELDNGYDPIIKVALPCDEVLISNWDNAISVSYLGNGQFEVIVCDEDE